MDEQTRTDVEAAVFRRFVQHLRDHPEAQNIELMVLADFCRNCLSKWYRAAAQERGHEISYDEAREIVYGMPYPDWKAQFQKEATPEQLAAFQARQKKKAEAGESP